MRRGNEENSFNSTELPVVYKLAGISFIKIQPVLPQKSSLKTNIEGNGESRRLIDVRGASALKPMHAKSATQAYRGCFQMESTLTHKMLDITASFYGNTTFHEEELIINGTQTYLIENCTFIQTYELKQMEGSSAAHFLYIRVKIGGKIFWWCRLTINPRLNPQFRLFFL